MKSLNKIKNLKKEIHHLKLQIFKQKLANLKAQGVRNLKIMSKFGNFATPYVLSGSIIVGTFYVLGGGLPIVHDTKNMVQRVYLTRDKENVEYLENYVSYDYATKPYLVITSPWEYDEASAIYKRTITSYDTSSDLGNLVQAVLDNDYTYIIENVPVINEIEQTTNHCDEQSPDYTIEAILYGVKPNASTLSVLETDKDNNYTTALDAGFTFVAGSIIAFKRKFRLTKQLSSVCEQYQKKFSDTTILENRLQVKKSLLKKLTRGGRS